MLARHRSHVVGGIQNAQKALDKIICNWWTVEIASMVASIATFATLILHLHYWDGRAISEWPGSTVGRLFGTLQASVSFLVTILRTTMLLYVGAALNQLKWYYTQHSPTGRRLGFLQALDDASRGALGSLTLLLSRDIVNWSSLGCIIIIAAFLLGTLTQSSVQQTYKLRVRAGDAKVAIALTYNSSHENGGPEALTARSYVEAAITAGWAHGRSLHVRNIHSIEDVFATPVELPPNNTGIWEGVWEDISSLILYHKCVDLPKSLISLPKNNQLKITTEPQMDDNSSLPKGWVVSHIMATGVSKNNQTEHAECALYWGIQHIRNASYNELLRYNYSSMQSGERVSNGEGLWLKSNRSSHMFEITPNATQGLRYSLKSCFTRSITENSKSGVLSYDEMSTRLFLADWNVKSDKEKEGALSRTLDQYVGNVAVYTSAAMRANSPHRHPGDARRREEIYSINGKYLIYAGGLLVLSMTFFLVTVWMTWNDKLWKSSLLPLLYHGFSEPFPRDLKTVVDMKEEAGDKAFMMSSDGERGLRLHERRDGRGESKASVFQLSSDDARLSMIQEECDKKEEAEAERFLLDRVDMRDLGLHEQRNWKYPPYERRTGGNSEV